MSQNPIQEMYRLADVDALSRNPHRPFPTPRPPGNVPYVVDNLWEWQRPVGYPSRRQCVCASPSRALAQQFGGAAGGRVYQVGQMDGARIAQLNVPDDKLHPDATRLHKTLLTLLGGANWLLTPLAQRQALAPLWMPCLTRNEVKAMFARESQLAGIRSQVIAAITFWNDVQLVSMNQPWPHEEGEIFFEADSWHLV